MRRQLPTDRTDTVEPHTPNTAGNVQNFTPHNTDTFFVEVLKPLTNIWNILTKTVKMSSHPHSELYLLTKTKNEKYILDNYQEKWTSVAFLLKIVG